jgi:hypothetical protein
MLLLPIFCRRSINCQRFGLITENNCAGELKVKTAAAGSPVFQAALKRSPASAARRRRRCERE